MHAWRPTKEPLKTGDQPMGHQLLNPSAAWPGITYNVEARLSELISEHLMDAKGEQEDSSPVSTPLRRFVCSTL